MPGLPVLTLSDTPVPTTAPQVEVSSEPARDVAPTLPSIPTAAAAVAPSAVATVPTLAAPASVHPADETPATAAASTPLPDSAVAVSPAPAPATETPPTPPTVESTPMVPTIPAAPEISLPSATAAPSAGKAMSPAQLAVVAAATSASPAAARARQLSQRSLPARVVRTGFIALLVAGLGVGARFGYDYYENGRTDAETSDAASATARFLPPVGGDLPTREMSAPSGQFVDMTMAFVSTQDAGGEATTAGDTASYTNRIRYSLDGTRFTENFEDAEGAYELDVRNGNVMIRPGGQNSWIDRSGTEEAAEVLDRTVPLHGLVPMFHDAVPAEAVPYVTVVSETVEQLAIVPLGSPIEETAEPPASQDGDAPSLVEIQTGAPLAEPGNPLTVADALPAAPPRPAGPVPVRHYTLMLDEVGFAAAAPHVHALWANGVGDDLVDGGQLDVWVDELGVIRQFRTQTAGGTFTFTLNDVADALPGFQNDSLIASAILAEAGE